MSPTIFDQHVVNTAKVPNKTHTGDVTDTNGALTVNKIKGVDISTFPNNSILKTTTGGIVAPAVAGDFPILNQSTIGNANTATFATTAGSATTATTATTANMATLATTTTNIAGGSIGSVPYQSASGTTSLLGAGTSGYVLTANGTSSAPSWSPINLSADVGGTLPVGKGGTGLTTITGYVKGTGTSALSTSPTVPVADISGTLPVANGGTGAVTLTGYVKGTGTTAMTAAATVPVADISGTLPVANGGTGLTTITGYVKGTGTAALSTSETIPVADISGTLPIANGGTGRTSFSSGYVKSDGTVLSTSATIPVSDISGLVPSPIDLSSSSNIGILPVVKGGTGLTTAPRGEIYLATELDIGDDTYFPNGTYKPIPTGGTIAHNVGTVVGTSTVDYIETYPTVIQRNTFSIKNTSGSTRVFLVTASIAIRRGFYVAGYNNAYGIKLFSGASGSLSEVTGSMSHGVLTNTSSDEEMRGFLSITKLVTLSNDHEIAPYIADISSNLDTLFITNAVLTAVAVI
jgi:hypothetical protein